MNDCSPDRRLKRLSENDPKITKFFVCENNRDRVAEALKGNTHIREMTVAVSLVGEEGASVSDSEMTSWTKFCEAAGDVASLRKLEFYVRGGHSATRKHFAVFGLLLRHTRQVKDILARGLYDGFPIRDPEYGRVLARHISSHPALESFEVCYFDCSHRKSSLATLLGALVTVPNLKSFTLDTHNQYHGEMESLTSSLEIFNKLQQLLRKATLRSVEFRNLAFDDIQTMAIAREIGCHDSQLQELSFRQCDLWRIAAFCREIAKSTSLQDLSLGCDPRDTISLGPLSTSQSLKELLLFGGGAPQAPPRITFLRENSVMESLHLYYDVPHSTLSMERLALLFGDVGANEHLQEITISGWEIAMNQSNLFSPLASNKALKKLSFTSCGRGGDDEGIREWPSFKFLLENQTLEHLVFQMDNPSAEGGFESMCQALWTNATLEILDLKFCGLQSAHCLLLAEMIVKNLGLREIHMNGNKFTEQDLVTLLAALKQNKSIRVLNVATISPVPGTGAFVKGVLSDTKVRDLVVGSWDGDDAKSLLRIAAENYCFECVHFDFDPDHLSRRSIWFRRKFQILEGTINAIAKLNKAGRCYLVNGSQGPECSAAGVNVLSRVIDDIDCIFFHLRENPVLCNCEFSG